MLPSIQSIAKYTKIGTRMTFSGMIMLIYIVIIFHIQIQIVGFYNSPNSLQIITLTVKFPVAAKDSSLCVSWDSYQQNF